MTANPALSDLKMMAQGAAMLCDENRRAYIAALWAVSQSYNAWIDAQKQLEEARAKVAAFGGQGKVEV